MNELRLFSDPQVVEVSQAERLQAWSFARDCINTHDYSDHNQHDKDRIINQIIIGRVGEIGTVKVYAGLGCAVVGPDWSVYEGVMKSWEPDLAINQIPVHVKAQGWIESRKYGTSWMFSADPNGRYDPVIHELEAYLSLTVVGQYYVQVYPMVQVKDVEFKPPQLKHLVDKKLCVYLVDVESTWGYGSSLSPV